MNRLFRLLQRLRGVDADELQSRRARAPRARVARGGVFARLRGLRHRQRATVAADPPRFGYSYTVFWLKHVRDWDAGRRSAVAAALERVLSAPDFVPTVTERRFAVEGLDEPHSGASLLALRKVLSALSASGVHEG